nr:hypothetical protein K-LCC10_0110 [Kaumoebavirus]
MDFPSDIYSEIFSHVDHPSTIFNLRMACKKFSKVSLPPWDLEVWARLSEGKYSDEFAEKYYDELHGMIEWEHRSEAFLDKHIMDVEWGMIDFGKCSEWFREKHGKYYAEEMIRIMKYWESARGRRW